MVQIQEEDDTDHHEASTSNHHTTTTSPPSPPPQLRRQSSHSTTSSISSDHTFHAFSPPLSPLPLPLPSPSSAPQAHLPIVSAARLIRDHPEAVTKTEPHPPTGFASVEPAATKPRRSRVGPGVKSVRILDLFLRFLEFGACLVSFAVMASDKRRGWAFDSYDRYIEFRYSMTVNVISFAYSGLQGFDLLLQLSMGKDLGRSQLRYCFDFAMDQILAYLLLSSASSAFTRVDDWISNWGNDKFPAMASASVGVSVVAFAAFALSSLISGYTLSTHRHS
ncbi:hypothetical protein vseg_010037 [Gypsophila vaccaria]